MKNSPSLDGKEESAPPSDGSDYAASYEAIAASQAGMAVEIGIIRTSA
jgi:hypothetical protein